MHFEIESTKAGRRIVVLHLRASGVERQHSITGEWLPRIEYIIGERGSDMSRTAVRYTVRNTELRGWVWRDATGELLIVRRLAWVDSECEILAESNGDRGWPSTPDLGPYPADVRRSAVLIGLDPIALIA